MRYRALVRRVQVEVRGEDRQALRIRCLDSDDAAALEAARRQSDHLGQALRRDVLHYLRAEDTVERRFGQGRKVLEEVGLLRLQSLVPAEGNRFLAEIDAARGDAQLPHGLQKLAAPAA